MCGIAGLVGLPVRESVIPTMLATMKRRGPDSQDYFQTDTCCLLHSRLEIIDPEGGKQPMRLDWAGEQYCIVYNGELYNTEEVRQVLQNLGHTFRGYSDTEVVLHAYAQWSERCVEKFNGIFAFAVWEQKRKKLFLARDRMGVKPLFFSRYKDGLIFASEMKTILSYPGIEARLDAEGVGQILLLGPGRIPGSGVFCDIKELEPGCFGYYIGKKFSRQRYWKLTDREHRDSFEETAEKVRYLVTDSIQRQMVSDRPLGTFLSGGLDSSLISSVCARSFHNEGKKLKTFSVDYQNNDQYFSPGKFQPASDGSFIKIMQEYLGSDPHWTVISSEELVNALHSATIARDLPGMADVDFSMLIFCGEISKHVKVALSGECADEIFGGYPWYRDPEVRSIAGFPWAQNTAERASFMQPDFLRQLQPNEFVNDLYSSTIAQSDILPGTPDIERRIKEMVNLNLRWFMQTLLDRKDRMSMYHGLEVRVPFCDYRIAEYLYSVPWSFKEHNGQEKGLLRYAMSDYLPHEVLYRKKSPYPKTYDPKYLEIVSSMLMDVIADKTSPILQIVRPDALENLLKTEYAWPWYGQLMKVPQTIAYMLQINFWLKHYNVKIV